MRYAPDGKFNIVPGKNPNDKTFVRSGLKFKYKMCQCKIIFHPPQEGLIIITRNRKEGFNGTSGCEDELVTTRK